MEASIPDLGTTRIVITGANTGLGKATVQALLNNSNVEKIILACRNEERAKAAMREVTAEHNKNTSTIQKAQDEISPRLDFLKLDLSDLDAVRASAADLAARYDRIDVCINNAGIFSRVDSRSKQGHELTMAVCHLGHFVFNSHIFKLLKKSKSVTGRAARIVSVASLGHEMTKGIDFDKWLTRKTDVGYCYADAKLANVQYMFALKRRLESAGIADQVTITSLQPGYARSELYDGLNRCLRPLALLMSTPPDTIAINPVRHAIDLEGIPSGTYTQCKRLKMYGPPVLTIPAKPALDEAAQERLWIETEKVVGERSRSEPALHAPAFERARGG